MVIETAPVVEGKPFPTTYWLTCPLLVQRASRLEAAGVMTKLTDRLRVDDSLRDRLAAAFDRYPGTGEGTPPGGGPERVKCLHAHVAHELADPPNPIGGLVLSEVGWPDCVVQCV